MAAEMVVALWSETYGRGWDLFMLDTQDGHLRRLTYNQHVQDFALSPDGAHIAFVSDSGSVQYLSLIGADGTGLRVLTEVFGEIGLLSWHPDGERISFISADHWDPSLMMINRDGAGLRYIVRGAGDHAWSPDGKRLAFMSFARESAGLHVMEADGSHIQHLLDGHLMIYQPTWTPDGQSLLFVGFPDHDPTTPGIYQINADGSGLRQIYRLTHPLGFALSPDGGRIAFLDLDADATKTLPENDDGVYLGLYVLELQSGEARRLVEKLYWVESSPDVPRWTPDGAHLLYLLSQEGMPAHLYSIGVDGSDCRWLTAEVPLFGDDLRLAWNSHPYQRVNLYEETIAINRLRARSTRDATPPEGIAAWGFWRKALLCVLAIMSTPPITAAATVGLDFGARGQVGFEMLIAVGTLLVAVVPFFLGWRFPPREPGVFSLVGLLCVFCLLMVGLLLLIDALLHLAPLSDGVHFVFFMLGLLGVAIPLAGLLAYRLYNRHEARQGQ